MKNGDGVIWKGASGQMLAAIVTAVLRHTGALDLRVRSDSIEEAWTVVYDVPQGSPYADGPCWFPDAALSAYYARAELDGYKHAAEERAAFEAMRARVGV